MITKLLAHIGIAAVVLSGSINLAFTGPDMTVTECVFSPAQPKEADFVTITLTFKNIGDQPAVFPQGYNEWGADLQKIQYSTTVSNGASRGRTVAPGGTFTEKSELARPAQLSPGAHSIRVTVDPTSHVQGESNRANNVKDCSLVVAAGGTFPPSLSLQGVKTETTPATSANIAIVGSIINTGRGAAVLPVGMTLVSVRDFGDAVIMQQETIAPGATKTFRIVPNHLLQPGGYTFHLQLDPSGKAGGSGGNWDLVANVQASGRAGELVPDLVIDSCVFDPAAPTRNQAINLRVTLKNIGTADARIPGGAYRWHAVYKGSTQTMNASNELIIIKPGMTFSSSERIFAANAAPVGTADITVILDSSNVVIESNETNNQKTCSITVK